MTNVKKRLLIKKNKPINPSNYRNAKQKGQKFRLNLDNQNTQRAKISRRVNSSPAKTVSTQVLQLERRRSPGHFNQRIHKPKPSSEPRTSPRHFNQRIRKPKPSSNPTQQTQTDPQQSQPHAKSRTIQHVTIDPPNPNLKSGPKTHRSTPEQRRAAPAKPQKLPKIPIPQPNQNPKKSKQHAQKEHRK